MITKLKSNEIFIAGSNLLGHHLGGAARQAYEDFRAEWGIGEGLTGQSYMFPTLGEDMQKLPIERLELARDRLYKCAKESPDKIFLLTRVGRGIAGQDPLVMENLFKDLPDNIKQI
jgi:hypothetical protein